MAEFLRAYLTVAVFAGAAGLLVVLLSTVGWAIRPSRPSRQKSIVYESGVDPADTDFSQSQVRYYIFALLFVFFDVEAVYIFPWAMRLETYGLFGLIEMAIFIVILALGLLYAWRKGVLRWV